MLILFVMNRKLTIKSVTFIISNNNMKDSDPNHLLQKFQSFHGKSFKPKEDCVEAEVILKKLLGIKPITREQ